MSIYVEILIRAPLDTVWQHTQQPDLHTRWDLRFTTIDYLPRASDTEPQRFRYATRLGFGLEVAGEGQSVGQRDLPGGERVSSLRFGSDDWRSLIREGGGYWKYVPTADGIRFLTWYDYRPRFGVAGAAFDWLVFRPLMGWATAWSFDRLRLWLEQGVPPDAARRAFGTRLAARGMLAAVFFYHGLVPKLWLHDGGETAMLREAGVSPSSVSLAIAAAGAAEILFAGVLLLGWRWRWPAVLCVPLMLAALAGVAWHSPRYLGAAFNPVTLNLSVIALALVDLLNHGAAPSAARCGRVAPRSAQP